MQKKIIKYDSGLLVIRLFVICLMLTGTGWGNMGDTLHYVLQDTIIVTGSRIPARITEVTRSVSVVHKEMIESLPMQDMDDLLKISAVEVNERSMGNVQADLSIRGSTFNQVSVFWDDININDPQTGHFFANVPAPFSAVEKVEVISGGNSALYGAQAFGGIIRFIPQQFEKTGFRGYYQHGSFNTRRTGADMGGKYGKLSYGNYFEYQNSDGMIKQLDYQTINNFTYGQIDFERSSHKIGVGIQRKKFGALDFYAPYNSFEKNMAVLVYVKNRLNLSRGFYCELNASHRFHKDRFILLRKQPDIYTNIHKTRTAGMDFHVYKDIIASITLVSGASFNFDAIHSRGIREGRRTWALGEHQRINKSLFTEGRFRSDHLILNAGYRLDYNSFYGYVNSPSVDAGYFLNANFKLKIAYSQSYRAPDYTELYYSNGRSNFGNENLTT